MTTSGDFTLDQAELRAVARYAAEAAQSVLPRFEETCPDDTRPRAALDAAWAFINGAPRSKLQRVTSLDAHRAAKEAPAEVAELAAKACGDAASAAYLHPIAKAHQVGHILRTSACVARIAEIDADEDRAAAATQIELAYQRATPVIKDVLRRYPPAPYSKNRIVQLTAELDAALRQ